MIVKIRKCPLIGKRSQTKKILSIFSPGNIIYRLRMGAEDLALFVDAALNQMKWHLGKITRKKSTKNTSKPHGYIRDYIYYELCKQNGL